MRSSRFHQLQTQSLMCDPSKNHIARHVKVEPGLEGHSWTSTDNFWESFQNIVQSLNPQELAAWDHDKKTHMFNIVQLEYLSTQLWNHKGEIDCLRDQLFQMQCWLDRESHQANNIEHDLKMQALMGRWGAHKHIHFGSGPHPSPLTDKSPAILLLYKPSNSPHLLSHSPLHLQQMYGQSSLSVSP